MNHRGIARDLVTVGASAGGITPLLALLSTLPSGFPGSVAVVVHRSPFHPGGLEELLRRHSSLPVVDPIEGALVERGRVYLAPADRHMVMDLAGVLRLPRSPKVHFTRPSADPLFESAAVAFGPRVVGVLLSGSGGDGLSGLLAIKARDGISIVQEPSETQHPSMALNAIRYDHVDAVLDLDRIAPALVALAKGAEVAVVPRVRPGALPPERDKARLDA